MVNDRIEGCICRGWDGAFYRMSTDALEVLFVLDDGEDLESVCNVDVFVNLPDGSRWSATVFTLVEVDRLMKRWADSEEALGGRYFWCSDGLIVREPGVSAMFEVIAGLLTSRDLHAVLQRLNDSE
jgi:hypothetical protein